MKVKSWSFVAALARSSLLRLRWYVSLNQLLMKALSASNSMVSQGRNIIGNVVNYQFVDLVHELEGVAYHILVCGERF